MPVCKGCGCDLDESMFRRRKSGTIERKCRACETAYQRERYRATIDVSRRRKREWMRKHRDNADNRERIKQRSRESWRSNPERKASAREYQERLKTKHFFVWRATRWNAHYARHGERITPCQLASLWRSQRGLCALSARKMGRDAHLDHIIPIASGGGHGIGNLRWLDPTVNLARRALSDDEFLSLCLDVVNTAKYRASDALDRPAHREQPHPLNFLLAFNQLP